MNWLDTALHLASIGWATFPVKPNTKEPLFPESGHRATTDAATLLLWAAEYPDANLALAGAKSGLVIVDVESRGAGLESWAKLIRTYSSHRDTLSATSQSGGKHFFYRAWRDVTRRRWVADHVEIKHSGAVLIEPSQICGRCYRFDQCCATEITADMAQLEPLWLWRLSTRALKPGYTKAWKQQHALTKGE